ncbi:MAG: class I SAM-dependent methyltransferase [Acidobacteria bacterium]|nr:class I SAM-dependent methyltransferase [Acidobacteriota bacterium]
MLNRIYARALFPWLLERLLGTPEIGKLRREALYAAAGHTLEIGFGTGLNLPYFPPTVTQLTVVDTEQMLESVVAGRVAAAAIPVERIWIDPRQQLPFPDQHFDCIVTTFTLCTIEQPEQTLAEIRRLLRPTGSYIFLEHGRSELPKIAAWQDRLNPLQRIAGAGCNLNRPIDKLLKRSGLQIEQLDRFLLPRAPRLVGEAYRGIARRGQTL